MRSFLLCFALFLTPLTALAEKRLGLVIGNDSYAQVEDLKKARADAQAVSDALQSRGYDVTTVLDATRRETNMRISEFIGDLNPGDTAFIFYAGHGVEIDGENYLLPTDIAAPASGEKYFVKSESIALSGLLDRVRATGARTTLAVIDACRDNPFEASNGRSIGGQRGLGRITAPVGTFVIFSAGAGQTALDRLSDNDPSANSVFTRLLLPRIETPGVELREMVSDLRRDVRDLARSVGHDQFPAYYDELLGEFFFTPKPGRAAISEQPKPKSHAAPDTIMRADFDLARSLNTRAAFTAFIDRYANQRDAFPVQMAMKLRDELAPNPRSEDRAAGQVASAPKPAPTPATPAMNRRDILRASQEQLNALGCSAGIADGISGPRTRAAFRRFLDASDSSLSAGDLGSEKALAVLKSRSGTLCAQAATAPKPKSSGTSQSTAPAQTAPQTPSYSMVGSWRWTANCPLGRVTGTTVYRSAGSSAFTGTINSSAGTGSVRGRLNGRNYSATENFGWATNSANGTLSADGRSLSLSVSNGCRVTARKN